MESSGFTTLSRQTGLMHEMRIIANNIANASTAGYRQEGMIFSEYITAGQNAPSISMGHGNVRNTSMLQGTLTETRGQFDFAIEGDGFFLVQTPAGERLTRTGQFTPSAEGDLVTAQGYPVLDAGGAPVFVPPDATTVAVAADGTISAGGRPLGQIGIVVPVDPLRLQREDGVRFRSDAGFEPAENPRVLQGFVEDSNVETITQLARMIEVQRAYELGQSFLDAEDRRTRDAVKALFG